MLPVTEYFTLLSSVNNWSIIGYTIGSALFCLSGVLYWHQRNIAATRKKLETPRIRFPRPDLPPVFPNGWIPVLESKALGIEAVKRLDVLGLELVAFRTKDGVAHVTDAHCPHLGAHLGVLGRVVGDCIECPFHGWRFNGDGACVHVPYDAKVPEFAQIKKWETDEVMGLLCVWYHAEGEKPSWKIEDVPEISSGGWKLFKRYEETVTGHIRDLAENGSDMVHFKYFHGPNFFVTAEEFSQNGGVTTWGHFLTHIWKANWHTEGHKCTVDIDADIKVFGKTPSFLYNRSYLKLQGPALLVVRTDCKFGKMITVTSITPEGPLQIRLIHRMHFDQSTSFLFRLLSSRAYQLSFQRDMLVWNNKTIWKMPPLQKEDRTIADFRRWYQQFYTKNSPTWQEVRDRSLQW
ncbi:unnamed protein product [Ixodes pacificus]